MLRFLCLLRNGPDHLRFRSVMFTIPTKIILETTTNALSDFSDSHSSAYEKVLILGDFSNVYVDDRNMKTFCEVII